MNEGTKPKQLLHLVFGGELTAGPRPAPERGFALAARLPLEPGARA